MSEKILLQIKKHSRYYHLAEILKICRKQPKTPTQIFLPLHNKLTYKILKEVLQVASKAKLIEETEKGYITTRKGELYIRRFKNLLKLLE